MTDSFEPPNPDDPTRSISASASKRSEGRIGPYLLLQKLGEGGMGEVWLAEQQEPIRRRVAVKLIRPGLGSEMVLRRFQAERQALALMDHPYVAKVFDAGTSQDGRPYFVMEHVRGLPITEFCNRDRLPVEDRVTLFARVCEGVNHAHQKGLIHRDLKPGNILVERVDGQPVPKIIDFGVAKSMGHLLTDSDLRTMAGTIIGTPEYMSPEQAEALSEDVDTRSDVYSLGVVLYELLVGERPIDLSAARRIGIAEVVRVLREQDPQPPSRRLARHLSGGRNSKALEDKAAGVRAKSVTKELDWITAKALEKNRDRRYGSVSELSADVWRFLRTEPVLAGPPSAVYWMSRFVRRQWRYVLVIGALVIVATVIAIATALLIRSRTATQELREFIQEGRVLERLADSGTDATAADRDTLRPLLDRLVSGRATAREQQLFIARMLGVEVHARPLQVQGQERIQLWMGLRARMDSTGLGFVIQPRLEIDEQTVLPAPTVVGFDEHYSAFSSPISSPLAPGPHLVRGSAVAWLARVRKRRSVRPPSELETPDGAVAVIGGTGGRPFESPLEGSPIGPGITIRAPEFSLFVTAGFQERYPLQLEDPALEALLESSIQCEPIRIVHAADGVELAVIPILVEQAHPVGPIALELSLEHPRLPGGVPFMLLVAGPSGSVSPRRMARTREIRVRAGKPQVYEAIIDAAALRGLDQVRVHAQTSNAVAIQHTLNEYILRADFWRTATVRR